MGEPRAGGPRRQGRARQPVGAGRQGRRAGGPAARRSAGPAVTADLATGSLEAGLRSARAGGRKLLVPYVTGGLPGGERAGEAGGPARPHGNEVGTTFSRPGQDRPAL